MCVCMTGSRPLGAHLQTPGYAREAPPCQVPGTPSSFHSCSLQPAASLPFLCHLHLLFMTSRLGLGSALKLVVHLKESRCQAVGRR